MSFSYIIKEGLSGFSRAKLAAVGSIITIAISLSLIGLFYIISVNTSRFVESVREKVELEAFVAEPVSSEVLSGIEAKLKNTEGIEDVRFISKEEAARIFKEEFGEDIKSVLDFNPLPPSFKITLKEGYRTPARAEEVHARIMEIGGIEDIAYRKELLELLDKRVQMLYTVGLIFGILLGVSAIILVSNTIRLTIYAKRKTVQTMKLVGASRWIVNAPFIVEGLLQGFFGALIACLCVYYLLYILTGFISVDLGEFFHTDLTFYGYLITAGILLGLLGSLISVRKFIGESVGS